MQIFQNELNGADQAVAGLLFSVGEALVRAGKKYDDDFDGLDGTSNKSIFTALRSRAELVVKELPEFNLTLSEAFIVSFLWYRFFGNGESSVMLPKLLSRCPAPAGNRFTIIQSVSKLIEQGILFGAQSPGPNRRRIRCSTRLDMLNMDRIAVRLQAGWIRHIIYGTPFSNQAAATVETETSNESYLTMWFDYQAELMRLQEVFTPEDRIAVLSDAELKLEEIRRIEQTEPYASYPFCVFSKRHELDDAERVIIATLLRDHVDNHQSDIDDLLKLISFDPTERMKNFARFQRDAKLIKREIIAVDTARGFMNQSKSVVLSMSVAMELLGREAHTNHERLLNFTAGSGVVEVVVPKRSMQDVVLSEVVRHDILTAVSRYRTDTSATLTSWGVIPSPDEGSKRSLPKLVMLFHGVPGTGKTLTAEVLARELGKDLIITDVSKILSAWVGESQQNTRKLFRTFAELNERLENPPVLLLNECDQLLSRRGGGRGDAVDRMYHEIQNLILEGLERMQGIVILTTNLIDTLDAAFSRRFDLKIRFDAPTVAERESIWKIHLLPTIPGVAEIDVSELARSFELSGGQIAVIVQNAATEAASRCEDIRKLTTDLLIKYAALELDGQFEQPRKRKVGFEAGVVV